MRSPMVPSEAVPVGVRRVSNEEGISEEPRVSVQRLQEHEVHRHPDGSAPVGVAAEHPGGRFGRDVVDAVVPSVQVVDVGVIAVVLRQRPNAVRRQELLGIEDALEDRRQAVMVHHREHVMGSVAALQIEPDIAVGVLVGAGEIIDQFASWSAPPRPRLTGWKWTRTTERAPASRTPARSTRCRRAAR